MMKRFAIASSAATLLLAFASCNDRQNQEVMGYAPVYHTDSARSKVSTIAPQPIVEAGKIYVRENTLFQVENGQGIHVLDISQPDQPEKLAFIVVEGAQELSIIDNILYTNSYNDLLVIDISDLHQAVLLNRVANTFKLQQHDRPPESGYFECPDPEKGTVIGWQKKMLQSPRCKY